MRVSSPRRIISIPAIAMVVGLQLPMHVSAQAPLVRQDTVEVDGARFHYRTAGSGPVLLLLHGFTGSGAWWDTLLSDFAARYTVVVPDLPGHGHSDGLAGAYRYTEAAADLYGLMDALGVDQFRAVGYSAGGIILLHMATQQPDRIVAMSLVSAIHVLPEAVRPILANWPSFEDSPKQTQEYWLSEHPGGEAQVQRLISALRSLGDVPNNMNFTTDQLSGIETRTLIVAGDRDVLVPLDLTLQMYSAIPTAELWVVPGQGHSPLWPDWGGSIEAARIFPEVVIRFLESGG